MALYLRVAEHDSYVERSEFLLYPDLDLVVM